MPLITPTAYFPPAHWFTAAAREGIWLLEARENYQRKGWRNRTKIIGPNGSLLLSIPLQKGKNQRTPIQEVTIAQEYGWKREHVSSIKSAYGRSPFYEFYADHVFELILAANTSLYQLNKTLIIRILELLNLPVKLTEADDFYGDQSYRQRPLLAPYQQVFTDRHGYQPGLSILDALFCLGPAFINHPLTMGAGAGSEKGT